MAKQTMMLLNLLFSAAILAFLIIIDLYALEYPFVAKIFPWIIGIPSAIGMLILTSKQVYRLRRGMPEKAPSKGKAGDYRAHASIMAWMAGFLIMIYLLGFLVSIPLFLFLYLKFHGLGWFRSLRIAGGVIIVIYGILSLAMRMDFYPGFIYLSYLK